MAFTNYLLQAFIIVPVCVAFGLFDAIAPARGLWLALAVSVLQTGLSIWCLKRHQMGPLERFARAFDSELPSFDQHVAAAAAASDDRSWASHIEKFRAVRASTLAFFQNLPTPAWTRRGIASGMPFGVRALAYLTAGHVIHHLSILQTRHLAASTTSATSLRERGRELFA
jgi:hypothetical protein